MKHFFTVPDFHLITNLLKYKSNGVVVVSIVCKADCKICKCNDHFLLDESKNYQLKIKGIYDDKSETMYLFLHRLQNDVLQHFTFTGNKFTEESYVNDFLAIGEDVRYNFLKGFFLLLKISHIVVLSNAGYSLDSNFIQHLKAVDVISKELFSDLHDYIKDKQHIDVETLDSTRSNLPRLLFYFKRCHKNLSNLKKMKHNLEDKLYHILKKARFIGNTQGSLFSIPLNEEFVYVENEVTDKLGNSMNGLMKKNKTYAPELTVPDSSECKIARNFQQFLNIHVEQVRTTRLDESLQLSLHISDTMFFSCKHWFDIVEDLYNNILDTNSIVETLTDTQFSDQRCSKVLPIAFSKYQENLPSQYAKSVHEQKLEKALSLFRIHARGPNFIKFSKQLEMECNLYWENGRQQCEIASLTGKPCILAKHLEDEEHNSGFIYKSVCDCGWKIASRKDPYNVKDANYSFYQQAMKDCECIHLERIFFPTIPSTEKEYMEVFLKATSDTASENKDGSTEYIPVKMLALNAPSGSLPNFPSWSLVCLGPSSLYSHNLGLSDVQHPGFINASNFLLPWDVTIFSTAKTQLGKYTSRGRRARPDGTVSHFTVKVFIGVEYECSLGHRFMLGTPDKILKASTGSLFKETGHKIADSDMPLYFRCPCRLSTFPAQLMRLHVVTPKAPVLCTLDPKVQHKIGSPIFVPTLNGPTKLTQSAYWILRLPYIYMDENEHYVENASARLLRGVFKVIEIDS